MKKNLLLLFIGIASSFGAVKAQNEPLQDSVIQINGIVMTADSLMGLPFASITVKNQNRGTYSNAKGVFSIVVLKGDVLEISHVGYLNKTVEIDKNLEGNQFSLLQLMTEDTVYLPATIIKSRPTREQFERDFVNTNVADDNLTIARRNNSEATRRFLAAVLPSDGRESSNIALNNYTSKFKYQGQTPPQNILNPAAWAEFIKAWKRGDFKKKR
jgi:hypothetical protein